MSCHRSSVWRWSRVCELKRAISPAASIRRRNRSVTAPPSVRNYSRGCNSTAMSTFEWARRSNSRCCPAGYCARSIPMSAQSKRIVFVLSLGAGAKAFARACGFDLPIYPVKGHSITINGEAGRIAHSVTDYSESIVFAPLRRRACASPAMPTSPAMISAGQGAHRGAEDGGEERAWHRCAGCGRAEYRTLGRPAADDTRQPPDYRAVAGRRAFSQYRAGRAGLDLGLRQRPSADRSD